MATLKVNRGTTYTISVEYKKDGVAATLVGATVRFTVKTAEFDEDATDAAALVTKNVTDGAADGTAEVVITPSDTSTIVPGNYFYDLKVEEAGGDIYKIDEGKFNLDGSPTNRLV